MSNKKNAIGGETKTGLELMREPFPKNAISKLPKPTRRQTDELREATQRKDFSLGIRCDECGGWHHKDVIHLDYVGHAALTDRLLDCDPDWNWEPLSLTETGLPVYDKIGGMWIRLTVCGVTRLGYGSADGKTGGDAIKEVIGDALRNAAMRFGAALDLWHKGDLHADDSDRAEMPQPKQEQPKLTKAQALKYIWAAKTKKALDGMAAKLADQHSEIAGDEKVIAAIVKMNKKFDESKPSVDDVIPY